MQGFGFSWFAAHQVAKMRPLQLVRRDSNLSVAVDVDFLVRPGKSGLLVSISTHDLSMGEINSVASVASVASIASQLAKPPSGSSKGACEQDAKFCLGKVLDDTSLCHL